MLLAAISLFLFFIGIISFLWLKSRNFFRKTPSTNQRRPAAIRPVNRDAPVAVRRRNVPSRARRTADERMALGEDSDNSASEDETVRDKSGAKVGVKKARKLADKAEKRREREEEERLRAERKKIDEDAAAERKRIETEEEARNELEMREAQEEARRKEDEAYQALKAEFEIAEEGENAVDEAAHSLAEFVSAIQTQKVVLLEDLADQFGLRTTDCIDRVRDLQADGRLTGVLDERGKFIYVTEQEYEDVAKFVRQRGRVTLHELAENSNRLIRLDGNNANTAVIV